MLETVELGPTVQVEGFALARNRDSSFPEKEGKQMFGPIQVDVGWELGEIFFCGFCFLSDVGCNLTKDGGGGSGKLEKEGMKELSWRSGACMDQVNKA